MPKNLAIVTHQGIVEHLDHLPRYVLGCGLHVRTAPLRAKDNGVGEVGGVPPSLREDSDEPHVGPHFGLVAVDPSATGESWCMDRRWDGEIFSLTPGTKRHRELPPRLPRVSDTGIKSQIIESRVLHANGLQRKRATPTLSLAQTDLFRSGNSSRWLLANISD